MFLNDNHIQGNENVNQSMISKNSFENLRKSYVSQGESSYGKESDPKSI